MKTIRRLSAFFVALIILLTLQGCGGSSTPDMYARLKGVVILDSSVTPAAVKIVDSSESIPTGAAPIAGAEVRIVHPFSNAVAVATAADDGSFSISALEMQSVIVEVRQNAASTDADLSMNATLIPGSELPLGRQYAISRDEAIAAVLSIVGSAPLVTCTQNPLLPGTLVRPQFSEEADESEDRTVGVNSEWLLLVDSDAESAWFHEVTYYFVDAATGEITTLTNHMLPTVNHAEFWDYEESLIFSPDLLSLMLYGTDNPEQQIVIHISPDLVQPGEEQTVGSASETGSAAGMLSGLGHDDARLLGTKSCVIIPREDRFAIVMGGTLEAWIARDVATMTQWCIDQGIPSANIVSVIYSKLRMVKTLWIQNAAIANVQSTVLVNSSSANDMVAAGQKLVADMAARIKARRDAGGHPCLFVSFTSHGSPSGKVMLLDDSLQGIYSRLRGNKTYVNLTELLPIHTIPACQIRMTIMNCFAGNQLIQFIDKFKYTDHDVEIFTAAGKKGATIHSVIGRLRDAYWDINKGWGTVFATASKVNDTYSDFAAAWTKNVRLNTQTWELSGAFDEWRVRPGSPSQFIKTRYDVDVMRQMAYASAPKNDRMYWSLERPDPCCPKPDTSIPLEEVDLVLSLGDSMFTHAVGLSECPQLAQEIVLSNGGSEAFTWVGTCNKAALSLKPASGSLAPGETKTVEVWFDCSTSKAFTGAATFVATGAGGETDTEKHVIVANIR